MSNFWNYNSKNKYKEGCWVVSGWGCILTILKENGEIGVKLYQYYDTEKGCIGEVVRLNFPLTFCDYLKAIRVSAIRKPSIKVQDIISPKLPSVQEFYFATNIKNMK